MDKILYTYNLVDSMYVDRKGKYTDHSDQFVSHFFPICTLGYNFR